MIGTSIKRPCVAVGVAILAFSLSSCSFPGEAAQASERVMATISYVNREVAQTGGLNVTDPSVMMEVICSTDSPSEGGPLVDERAKHESQFSIFLGPGGDVQDVVDSVANALRGNGVDVSLGDGEQSVPLRAVSARFGDTYALTGPFDSDERGSLMYFSGTTRCYTDDSRGGIGM